MFQTIVGELAQQLQPLTAGNVPVTTGKKVQWRLEAKQGVLQKAIHLNYLFLTVVP